MATFKLPKSLTRDNLNHTMMAYNQFKAKLAPFDKVVIDFTDCTFIKPVGAVLVTAFHDDLTDQGHSVVAKTIPQSRVASFLKALGVLRPIDASVEDAYANAMSQYSVKLNRYYSPEQADMATNEIMKHIVSRTHCSENTKAAIAMMIQELVDNAGRHGYMCYDYQPYPKPVYICAFSYSDSVEIGILDRGQGIHASLQQVEEYQDIQAQDALELALQRGVSGAPNGSPGFGLYCTSEFIRRNDGELVLWSSRQGLTLKKNRIVKGRSHNRGTVIALKINARIDIPFEEIVQGDTAEDLLERWGLEQ